MLNAITVRTKWRCGFTTRSACGLTIADVDCQMWRTFNRPVGEPAQEIGGVGITLLGLAHALGVSADDEEAKELERVQSKPAEHWQKRDAAKRAVGVR